MEFLLFQIKRVFGLLANIFLAPGELFGMIWDGSGRSNSLVLGLPSAVIGITGFCSVFLMQWGGTDAMVKSYLDRVESNNRDQRIMAVALRQSLIRQLSTDKAVSQEVEKLQKLKAEDPRTKKIAALSSESIVYLNKLVSLEPDNKNHLFQLAVRYFNLGDTLSQNRALGILSEIAPLNKTGHPEAHLQLARRLERLPAKSAVEKRSNLADALEHVKHCLVRDASNVEALKVQARLLQAKGARKEAKGVFEKLFEHNPIYFQALLELGVDGAEKASMLDSASSRYLAELRDKDVRDDTIKWVQTWEGVANVLTQKKEFEKLKELLMKDLQEYSQQEKTAGRVPLLKQYLCRLYLSWATSEIGNPLIDLTVEFSESDQLKLLDYIAKAYSYNEDDNAVLQYLTKLGGSEYRSVSDGARQIYDPSISSNLPPGVLNLIALESINKGNYRTAQKFYEQARNITPNNPVVLNNLAFSYLKEDSAENPLTEDERISNASRAHRLVEQAMRLLPENYRNSSQMSMYRHTMGTALMQLGNYPTAVAQFELALASRPNGEDLLESVIECYQLYGLDPSVYERRLAKVRRDNDSEATN